MRDYDPTTGRYIEADPLGLVDGASVYGYARQNPRRYVDPRGEATEGALVFCVAGGPFNPVCDAAVVVNACKWVVIGGMAIILLTADECEGCITEEKRCEAVYRGCRQGCIDAFVAGEIRNQPDMARCIHECVRASGC